MLNQKLMDEFLIWSATVKKNSLKWVSKQRRILEWWMKVLPRRDLRKLTLKDDIVPKLTSLGAICCASPAAPQGLPAVLTLREVDGGLHQGLSRSSDSAQLQALRTERVDE